MSLLERTFSRCRASQRPALIPFITAGDPSLEQTNIVIDTLVDAGADVIEIGFPYSDPLADGPVIQASYTRALAANTTVDAIFTHSRQWISKHPTIPFLAMVSYSLIFKRGTERFLIDASLAGFTGLIIPDLPLEEAVVLSQQAAVFPLALIQLVTPATPPERAALIAQTTTGFLYVVSITGITGARSTLPEQLVKQLQYLRGLTKLPLCVGFGISQPEQIKLLSPHVDGIIVGSALVKCLEGSDPFDKKLKTLNAFARQLRV